MSLLIPKCHDLRDDLVQVAFDRIIRKLHHRAFRILVDRYDDLGGLHTCLVLDRAADAACKVDLRLDRRSGLSYLVALVDPACVYRRSGCADYPADLIREFLHQRKAFRAAEASSA